jgi:hypothetical protein
MKTAVIILNWNGRDYLRACLDSVLLAVPPEGGLGVYVVDNGSGDGSLEMVKEQFSEVRLIENQVNLGFAEGNNVGLRAAAAEGAENLIVLNNDTLVDEALFINLLSAALDREVGLVSPKIYFAAGREFHHERYREDERGKVIWYAGGLMDWKNVYAWHRGVNEVDRGQFDRRRETEFATGCCLLIKKSVLEKVGFFDPAYFVYWEDSDLCQRAKRAGFRIVFAPLGKVWHFNAGSSGGPGSEIHRYYQTRNRLIFGMRYASWRTRAALAKESLRMLLAEEVKREAVMDFWRHRWGKREYLGVEKI